MADFKMSLKDRAKNLNSGIEFMEGRTNGELKSLVGTPVNLIDYDYLTGENGEYVVFIISEDDTKFYFGGKVLTENLKELDADGYREEIIKNGLPMLLGEKASSTVKGRKYTTVEFYPEVKEKPAGKSK
jgi:hypothetical protein